MIRQLLGFLGWDTMNNTKNDWTPEEKATFQRLLRYAIAIFTAIGLTLVVVAVASTALNG
jgi:hypothetical protein